MADYSSITAQVQKDWKNREFIENISMNVLKITEFLNRFDLSTRFRIARVDERLMNLERKVEFIEATLNTALNPNAAQNMGAQDDYVPPPPSADEGAADDTVPPPPDTGGPPPPPPGDFDAPVPPPPGPPPPG